MGVACCSDLNRSAPETFRAEAPVNPANHVEPFPSNAQPSSPQPALQEPTCDTNNASEAGGNANEDQFVSQVGELPKFEKPSQVGDDADNASEISGVSQQIDAATAKAQKQQAKALVKDFVKSMVKGKKMNVMSQNGQLKTCTIALSRTLDSLSIKVGPQSRNIALKDVEEINAGEEVEGITTPLDELCATVMLASEDCITFRFNDIEQRDTFVMCLLMFCNNQKQ